MRRARGISQRELAEFAGVRRSTVSRIESGQTGRPSLELMDRIVRAGGFALVIADEYDRILELDDHRDLLRDRAGRRYPAHLRLYKVNWYSPWWGWWRIAWTMANPTVPEWSFHRRPTRYYGHTLWDDAT